MPTSSTMFMSMSGSSERAGSDLNEAGEFAPEGSEAVGESPSVEPRAGGGGGGACGCSIRKGRVRARCIGDDR